MISHPLWRSWKLDFVKNKTGSHLQTSCVWNYGNMSSRNFQSNHQSHIFRYVCVCGPPRSRWAPIVRCTQYFVSAVYAVNHRYHANMIISEEGLVALCFFGNRGTKRSKVRGPTVSHATFQTLFWQTKCRGRGEQIMFDSVIFRGTIPYQIHPE